MKAFWLLLLVPLFGIHAMSQTYKCLPAEVTQDDVVSATPEPSKPEKINVITVAQTLKKLKAKCSRGKLVDRKGRQIRFFRLQGCWGNPPFNYQEILAKQAKEIAALKKKYIVIEMTCNPSGHQIP